MKRCILSAVVISAILLSVPSAQGAELFSDAFSTAASSANYTAATFGESLVTYAWDYSFIGIPPAPNTTDGSTLGVKFEVNMSSGTANSAVTLHTNQSFTGAYTVSFDAWINANGPWPAGGTGGTQFLTAGVGGNGTTVNRGAGGGINAWTAVDGEGGSGIDYRVYKNTTLQDPASTQYSAGTATTARNATDPYYSSFGAIDVAALPVQGANAVGGVSQQTGTTLAGTFGFAWHEVQLIVDPTGGTGGATSMTWVIDDLSIAKLNAGIGSTFSTDGKLTLGMWDPFASVSDNPLLSFGLIDNVKVESVDVGVPGDFNDDGKVDGRDFLVWQRDTNVGALADWQANYGTGSLVASVSVPEPGSLMLISIGMIAFCRRATRFSI